VGAEMMQAGVGDPSGKLVLRQSLRLFA